MDYSQVLSLAQSKQSELVEFLCELIRIPAESCREEPVIRRIETEMRKLGFDEVWIDKMGNLIGRIGSGPIKVVMDGHVDTVGVGDPAAWKHPPFDPQVIDGKIYGRGTCDMRGAVASLVYGAAIMKQAGLVPPDVSVYVTATVMEEDCDGLPLLHLFETEGLRADYVLIAEPTALRVYRGHRGRMEIRVHTKGKAAHGAHCERGVNALYKMAKVMQGVERLNKKLKHDDFLGKGTVTVSCCWTETPSLCSVPDKATIHLDRRLTTGETWKGALAEIRALPEVKETGAKVELLQYDATAWTGLQVGQEKYFPTWVLPESHEVVRAAVAATQATLGVRPAVSRWVFSTNGVASMGRLGIPTVGFGPGHEELAHSVDEYIPVDHLVKAAAVYAAFPGCLSQARREPVPAAPKKGAAKSTKGAAKSKKSRTTPVRSRAAASRKRKPAPKVAKPRSAGRSPRR